MSEALAAIDADIAEAQAAVERAVERHRKLLEIRASYVALTSEAEEPKGGKPRDPALGGRSRRRARKAPAKTKALSESQRTRQAKAGSDRRRQIAQTVARAGADGITARGLREQLGGDVSTIRGHLRALSGAGTITSQHRASAIGGPIYRAAAVGLVPADENGAKTAVERKLVEAIRAAPTELTTSEVAKKAEVNQVDATAVLNGLARRDVVRTLPRRSENNPRRWAMPVAAAA